MQHFMFILLSAVFGLSMTDIHAQTYEWEIDRIARLEQENQKGKDSLLTHRRSRWELSLTGGPWFFTNSAKSSDEELFFLPQTMTAWKFRGSWYLNRGLSLDLSLGFQLNKDTPPSPNIGSVLSGENIELEGSGTLLLPIELGMRYVFPKETWKPFIGVSTGMLAANAQYILAEGNLVDGINRSEIQTTDRTWLGSIQAGILYRIGKHTNIHLSYAYYVSDTFDEPIGGYFRYEGSVIQAGLSIIY